MTQTTDTLHPDDVLLFHEVVRATKNVAKQYELHLKEIQPHPDCSYAKSPLGDCAHDGTIRLTMRGKTNGVWDEEPRHEEDVWDTAAHELAHLKHMNHGIAFQEFETEMLAAIRNRKQDHREKVLARLVKMQAQRDGEATLGNLDAAEAFAAAINRMLIDYELNPSDIDYARTADTDPIVDVRVDLKKYGIKAQGSRIAWQEQLARIVATAHLCTFLISTRHNSITFVGTKSHATVAEYVYGTLVPPVKKMSLRDYEAFMRVCIKEGRRHELHGFMGSWLHSFMERLSQRFDEARKAAVAAAAPGIPGGESTAMVRLDGALAKVKKHIDDRFSRKRKYASALNSPYGHHEEGRAKGLAAANSMVIGRRGVTGERSPKLLGS